tara:strand:- start:128924 stop:129220 length:297 start_codon:yes stop_codon:yes gene_type:complete
VSKRTNEFISIKEALKEMLQENKLQHGMDQLAVKEAWKAVMGNGVYSYTTEVVLKKNVLIIELCSSTLREELSYGKEKIITMMNENLQKAVINKVKLL